MSREALMDDWRPAHPRGVRRSLGKAVPTDDAQLALQALSVPTTAIRGMVHGSDGIESQAAAVRALPKVEALRQRILATLALHGPLSALEIEAMPEYADAGDYAVRRRCSDLTTSGRVVRCGSRGGAGLLDIPGKAK